MAKSVLISIKPKWCELIANGKKTIEVRKSRTKLETPFKCYVYQSNESRRQFTNHRFNSLNAGKCHYLDMGNVIGEFVCDDYIGWGINPLNGLYMIFPNELAAACLTGEDCEQYGNGKMLYGWHISDLKIYDRPRDLGEFGKFQTAKCNGACEYCDHWKSVRVNADEFDMDCDCGYEVHKFAPLTRPPQSWCYIEDGEQGG